MVRRLPISSPSEEVPADAMEGATRAVIKVHCKEEVLRFRVTWPLDPEEVQSVISSTLQGNNTASSSHQGILSTSKPDVTILYCGSHGKLLELRDASFRDFINRHSDPAQPIRLHVVAGNARHEPSPSSSVAVCNELAKTATCADGVEAISSLAPATGAATGVTSKVIAEAVAENPAEAIFNPSSEGDADSEGKPEALTADQQPAEASSLEAEFLGGYRKETCMGSAAGATGSTSRAAVKTAAKAGISLPFAARAAAYALSDMFESARDKLNEALAVQDSATPARPPSQDSLELQIALRESQELQRAIEKSAAESRVRLAKVLDLYQLRLRPVQADGNCQFRALSVQLCGDENQHAALRARVVKQLQERPDRYEGYMLGTYKDYLERMALDGQWGDNVTLQAASDLLNTEIHVLTDQPGSELLELRPEAQTDSKTEEGQPQSALCLAFLTEVHYDAVMIETA